MILKRLLQALFRFWHRCLAPFLPPLCRFEPSCSVYAVEALEKHHLARALILILKRLGRCHPLHPGGYDPVPDRAEQAMKHRQKNG